MSIQTVIMRRAQTTVMVIACLMGATVAVLFTLAIYELGIPLSAPDEVIIVGGQQG
jgi:high-affinity Fe2+/Pb2+ permease